MQMQFIYNKLTCILAAIISPANLPVSFETQFDLIVTVGFHQELFKLILNYNPDLISTFLSGIIIREPLE